MLSRVLSKRIAPFSQLYYRPSVLEYPINRNDSELLKNKQTMESVNNSYSNILKKVTIQNNKKVLDKLHK